MKPLILPEILAVAAGALLVLAVAGCGRDSVKVYQVEKNDAPAVAPAAVSGAMPAPDAGALPQLKWTLPEGWQETTPGQMRVASFSVMAADGQTVDVGVIPLPATGQEIQLVNMWREQMKLPAATSADAGTEAIAIGDVPGKLFDIASSELLIGGESRARILVAMLTSGGTSWFFKMTGEDALVTAQKPAFIQFLKTVNFVANAASTPQPMSGTSLGNQNFVVPNANTTVTDGKPIWIIPAGWQSAPPSLMLVAKFIIAGADDAQAAVNISSLAGEGGGLLANANRWRRQLGLDPLNEMELAHLNPTVALPGGGQLTLVDFTGTDSKTGKPARLVGAAVPQDGQTWFYKLMGDEAVVAQQKDAFIQFIQSANYANARKAP